VRIFLSYGHDRNTRLVDRVRADLQAHGHDVWIDTSEIKSGDDWRRRIVDGLKASDWTLGFLSRYSARDPGVCLDELAIALHAQGGTIATVLVEAESEVRPPMSVSHIQWLDMHDWEAREAAGGAEWDAWYRAKLDEILSLLASPATKQFAGEIKTLDRLLRPVSQQADVGRLVDGFVGRQWLLQQLEQWRRHNTESRLFWIAGAPGTGKSAFAAWLAHYGRANVIGLNLCLYNVEARRNPAQVIRTLAFQIASRLPDYRRLLLDRPERHDPDGKELRSQGAPDLFHSLLLEPLTLGIDGGRRTNRYLVVIDALDETIRDGRSELAEILADYAPKLPKWIALVVTSRPEAPILRPFSALSPHQIDSNSPENLSDAREFCREWLAPSVQAAAELEPLVAKVVDASEGSFLYLQMRRQDDPTGRMIASQAEAGALPRGLVGYYERAFERQFPDHAPYRRAVPLLEILVAAAHPVPTHWLERLGWPKTAQQEVLDKLGSIFVQSGDGIGPFHKSLHDWLAHDAGPRFTIDVAAGTRRLADALWATFIQPAGQGGRDIADRFFIAELPIQIGRAGPWESQRRAMPPGGWTEIWDALIDITGELEESFAWDDALAWWRAAEFLAKTLAADREYFRCGALVEVGRSSAKLGQTAEAVDRFRQAADIASRKSQEEEPRAKNSWRLVLSRAEENLGDLSIAAGQVTEALDSYRAALAAFAPVVADNPANKSIGSQMASLQEKTGDAHFAKRDYYPALSAYRAAVSLLERFDSESDLGGQLRISTLQRKIGKTLIERPDAGDPAAALTIAGKIAARLLAIAPNQADFLRNESLVKVAIGDFMIKAGDAASALNAYRQAAATAELLAGADRRNIEWRLELAMANWRLAQAGDEPQRRLAAAIATLRELELDGKLNTENQRFLSDAQKQLAALSIGRKGDTANAQ
jgi:tetratricopeptide (TPR) repeat protein